MTDDLISRAEAIYAVQHAFDMETLLNSFVRKVAVDALKTMPSAQPTYTDAEIEKMQDLEQAQIEKAYQLGREDAQSERKTGKWIPCSERLPAKTGHYLCSFKKPNRIDNIFVDLAYWTGGRWYGYLANEINAWMQLPMPYEVEK